MALQALQLLNKYFVPSITGSSHLTHSKNHARPGTPPEQDSDFLSIETVGRPQPSPSSCKRALGAQCKPAMPPPPGAARLRTRGVADRTGDWPATHAVSERSAATDTSPCAADVRDCDMTAPIRAHQRARLIGRTYRGCCSRCTAGSVSVVPRSRGHGVSMQATGSRQQSQQQQLVICRCSGGCPVCAPNSARRHARRNAGT